MPKPISFFSGYSQRENRVTNYCMLVLKMIYEENPKYLGEVLTELVGEEVSSRVGVVFRQQERRGSSTPDGLVVQSALTIYIETKNFDWFYQDQLKRHLATLKKEPGCNVLLALSKFDSKQLDKFDPVRRMCRKSSVLFSAITFEDFVKAVQIESLPKNLADMIAEFRAFLSEEDLLSSWDQLLDVVNCVGFPEDVLEHNVYMCPASGGAYSHSRCRFFGMYRNKRVECVAHIEGVVEVDRATEETRLLWNNGPATDDDLKHRAREIAKIRQTHLALTRVFLLGPLTETDFIKDTPGGMYGSKQYFNVGTLRTQNAQELADQLRGKTWTAFKFPSETRAS